MTGQRTITSLSPREEIFESFKQHIESKHIDAVLTMGTLPVKMAQEFNFDIPLLMYGVSDPVGSGLIKSAKNSGDARYWAHVDVSAYSRQMQYYYETLGFKNIGSVDEDEIICALPDYRKSAFENDLFK